MRFNIRKIRFVFVGIFVLFSLTSCSVKDAFFDGIGISFFKPLHQNKVSLLSVSCTSFVIDNQNFHHHNGLEFLGHLPDEIADLSDNFSVEEHKIRKEYFFQNIIKSPPKYILFQCLKISF